MVNKVESRLLPTSDSGGEIKNRTGISRGKFEEDAHFGNSPPLSEVGNSHISGNLPVGQTQGTAFLYFQTHPLMLQSIRDKILL